MKQKHKKNEYPIVVVAGYHKASFLDQRPYYIVEHVDINETVRSLLNVYADIPNRERGFLLENEAISVSEPIGKATNLDIVQCIVEHMTYISTKLSNVCSVFNILAQKPLIFCKYRKK